MFVGLCVEAVRRHEFSSRELGLPVALAIIGLLTFFCAHIAWRLWRGSLSSNGVTFMPTWFIQMFGVFVLAGTAFAAYQMAGLIISAVFFGPIVTWAVTKYFYDHQRRSYLRETTAQMVRSMEIRDHLHATHVMLYLSTLRALESGDSERAKRDLASGAAVFCHQFCGSEQSQWIRARKREVELLAKSSRVLCEALETRQRKLER